MKEQFNGAVDVQVHLNDAEAARGYVLRGSTTVLVNDQWVPLGVATSRARMVAYLTDEIGKEEAKLEAS
jgi:hypothetical protein